MTEAKIAKVYAIENSKSEIVYVGSTTRTLHRRLIEHKSRSKSEKKKHFKLYQHVLQFDGWDEFSIRLIKEFVYESKEHILKMEGDTIKSLNPILNHVIPSRSKKEYYEDNKQEFSDKGKEYYVKNKENISKRGKKYREQNQEKIKQSKHDYYERNKAILNERKKEYYENNKEQILKQTKQYREQNKDLILERKLKPRKCECGSMIASCNYSRHLKSKKHLLFIEN